MYTNLYITYIYLFVYFKSDYFSVIFTSVSFRMDKSVHILPITTENFKSNINYAFFLALEIKRLIS